jgi:predicted transcriptional regulator of viral defense system
VHENYRVVVLSGKQTGRFGVVSVPVGAGLEVPTTTLERTLIDIAVRPTYGGGPHQVLSVFRAALKRVSISAMIEALDVLDYLYPYHQALGFYLQRAGASDDELEGLRSRGMRFKFYLAHALKDPAYDASWKIFHPKRL